MKSTPTISTASPKKAISLNKAINHPQAQYDTQHIRQKGSIQTRTPRLFCNIGQHSANTAELTQ
jgi:hypothetical protein